ncbi:MAG TPA: adenine deaminase [Anaerolineae bacterium]|nr:adenine deaminase [Anaerolineae bacterium]HIQ11945.1 adenine deaminase [Caldilineales bacterium]
MELAELVRYARGDDPAHLLLKNVHLVNVLSGEILNTHVAIARSRIVGLGDGYEAEQVIDLEGAYLAPGFIDAHVHIESSMAPPSEFARTVVPRGTTTVVTDPHEIANVLGLDGIRFMFESAKHGPLSMYVMASSCVPATTMETNGATLHWYDLVSLKSDPWVLGLAEVMNFPGVIYGDDEVLDKLRIFREDVIDGHAPGVTGQALQAYIATGIGSDHEATTVEEAREKLRAGMMIFIREATNAHNLKDLLPLVNERNHHRFAFCTDDRQPADLLDEGHIDYMVRTAIAEGLDPIIAIRMATWNPAQYFRLHDRGAITAGRRADLIIFDDLQAPRPRMVFRGGKLVARDGVMTVPPRELPDRALRHTMNVAWDKVNFDIPAQGRIARVIGHIPNQLITEHLQMEIPSANGLAQADPQRDILKIAVIERHMHSGHVGKGFIHGMGLKRGALASSVAHDHHNIVVIGADDVSMMTAARRVAAMGGGLVAAEGQRVLAEVPLPLAGLMSKEPMAIIRDQVDAAIQAAHHLGSPLHDPFMGMSFMALEVIPSLKLTDLGLVDVDKFEFTSLWVE